MTQGEQRSCKESSINSFCRLRDLSAETPDRPHREAWAEYQRPQAFRQEPPSHPLSCVNISYRFQGVPRTAKMVATSAGRKVRRVRRAR